MSAPPIFDVTDEFLYLFANFGRLPVIIFRTIRISFIIIEPIGASPFALPK